MSWKRLADCIMHYRYHSSRCAGLVREARWAKTRPQWLQLNWSSDPATILHELGLEPITSTRGKELAIEGHLC